MKIEDIEKEGKIHIENLLDYHIDYTIINNEEDNYETGREHALSEFGADIFKAGAEWMKKYFSWVSVLAKWDWKTAMYMYKKNCLNYEFR